jgi:DNA-binding transcriptional MocR family regulator
MLLTFSNAFASLYRFSTDSSKFKNYLRLSTTRYGDQTLTKAVSRIGEALKELQAENNDKT